MRPAFRAGGRVRATASDLVEERVAFAATQREKSERVEVERAGELPAGRDKVRARPLPVGARAVHRQVVGPGGEEG
jgi:hypothetical protein